MAQRIKVASDWLAGCSGCHMSFLDIDERIVNIIEKADLTATPITDLKHPSPEGVDVGILEGAVNNSTTERVARQMRERCKILIALGDCACFGGIVTMRNFVRTEDALRRAYIESESTVNGQIPRHEDLSIMQNARAVDQVVPVDIYIPGCPPSADAIYYVLSELLAGRTPVLQGKFLHWH